MASNELPEHLEWLNKTELLELLHKPGFGGHRLRRSLSFERLIELIQTGVPPEPHEIAETTETRIRLQAWIEKYSGVISQIPCSGPLKGKCTVYPCCDGRHVACWMKTEGQHL